MYVPYSEINFNILLMKIVVEKYVVHKFAPKLYGKCKILYRKFVVYSYHCIR